MPKSLYRSSPNWAPQCDYNIVLLGEPKDSQLSRNYVKFASGSIFLRSSVVGNLFRENTFLPVQEQHMAGVSGPVQPFFTNLRFSLLCKMFNSLDHQVELWQRNHTLRIVFWLLPHPTLLPLQICVFKALDCPQHTFTRACKGNQHSASWIMSTLLLNWGISLLDSGSS